MTSKTEASRNVLIVGASRGIGLGLVDVHLSGGWEVHATTRDGMSPRVHDHLAAYQLDVLDQSELASLIDIMPPVDRVIHNAGVLRAPRAQLMAVNAEAPMRVVETLIDAGRVKPGGKISIMTSQMGSRGRRPGSLGDYGDSKAALNDEFRKRAPEWLDSDVLAVVIHPGWVQTDMGGPGAAITVQESAEGIARVMDQMTPDDHGKFLTWDGREHPW